MIDDLPVGAVAAHQLRGQGHIAGGVLQSGLGKGLAPDGGDGIEGVAALVGGLQVLNGGLAGPLVSHDDILHGRAHGRLDGNGVGVVGMDQRGDRPVDALQAAAAGLLHGELDRLGVALVGPLHLLIQGKLPPGGLDIDLQPVAAGLDLIPLFLPGLQPEPVALDGIARAGHVFPGLVQSLFAGGIRRLDLLQPGLGQQVLGVQLLPAADRKALGLLAGGQLGPALGELLHDVGLGRGPMDVFARQLVGVVGVDAALLLPGADNLLQGGVLGLDLGDPALMPSDLRLDGIAAAVGVLELQVQPPDVGFVVGFVAFEDRDAALHLPDVGLELHQGVPQRLQGAVLPVQGLTQGLREAVEPVQGLVGLLQDEGRGAIVLLRLFGSGGQPVKGLQPHGDLQALELLAVGQVLPGLLRLHPQGLDLQFQFGYFIPDAGQIVLGVGQPSFRLLLTVAEAGDARGLLEDLASVHAAQGQNFVNSALADVGVALSAQAGVHEQLVDVPQSGRAAVDIVFALAGAVVTPGDGDLFGVVGQGPVGIVQHQGRLREAHRAALLGAAEDDVLHFRAAKGLGALFAHDPADRIGNIGFSRAVRPDDGGDIVTELQDRLVREGLEALDLQRFQIHAATSSFRAGGVVCSHNIKLF